MSVHLYFIVPQAWLAFGKPEGLPRLASDVEIHHVQRVFLDELAAALDVFTHQG